MFFITNRGTTFIPKLLEALCKEGVHLKRDRYAAEQLDNNNLTKADNAKDLDNKDDNKEENG